MKPYAYMRWRICYVTSRCMGYGRIKSAVFALFAMRRIEIKFTKH